MEKIKVYNEVKSLLEDYLYDEVKGVTTNEHERNDFVSFMVGDIEVYMEVLITICNEHIGSTYLNPSEDSGEIIAVVKSLVMWLDDEEIFRDEYVNELTTKINY